VGWKDGKGGASLGEISTRIWLDEGLWDEIRSRAIADGVTVRELLPRLVAQALSGASARAEPPVPAPRSAGSSAASAAAESGPPVLVLSDIYRCDVCGAQVKLGGMTIHMGKHMKERQAPEAERS